jgi:hypothetical protein
LLAESAADRARRHSPQAVTQVRQYPPDAQEPSQHDSQKNHNRENNSWFFKTENLESQKIELRFF